MTQNPAAVALIDAVRSYYQLDDIHVLHNCIREKLNGNEDEWDLSLFRQYQYGLGNGCTLGCDEKWAIWKKRFTLFSFNTVKIILWLTFLRAICRDFPLCESAVGNILCSALFDDVARQ